jgi:hypothetical protein
MGDWTQPALTDFYADFLGWLVSRDIDTATLGLGTLTNPPVGFVKYDRTNDKFQEWNGATWDDLIVSLEGGGTGAANGGDALTNLGIGTLGLQDANNVTITGGSVSNLGSFGVNGNWTLGGSAQAQVDLADQLLIKPEIKDYSETIQSPSVGATTTINFENGNVAKFTLNQNTTLAFTNPPASGRAGSVMIKIKQDATGSRTLSWPGSVVWPYNVAPIMTPTANKTDIYIVSTDDGGTLYNGAVYGQNY